MPTGIAGIKKKTRRKGDDEAEQTTFFGVSDGAGAGAGDFGHVQCTAGTYRGTYSEGTPPGLPPQPPPKLCQCVSVLCKSGTKYSGVCGVWAACVRAIRPPKCKVATIGARWRASMGAVMRKSGCERMRETAKAMNEAIVKELDCGLRQHCQDVLSSNN